MNENERKELISHWINLSTSGMIVSTLIMTMGTFTLLYAVLAIVFNLNLNIISLIALLISIMFFSFCSCYAFKTICETEIENGLEMLYLFMQDTEEKMLEDEINVKSKKIA